MSKPTIYAEVTLINGMSWRSDDWFYQPTVQLNPEEARYAVSLKMEDGTELKFVDCVMLRAEKPQPQGIS